MLKTSILKYWIYEKQPDGSKTLVRTGTVQSVDEFIKLTEDHNYKIGILENLKFGYKWIFQNGEFKTL